MNRYIGIALVVLAFVMPYLGRLVNPSPVDPSNPAVSDIVVWKSILLGMAEFIEADGRTSKPLFDDMGDVEQYRNAVVSVPIRGIGGGAQVQALLAPKLSPLGTGRLDATSRAAVVAAFRTTSQELK